MKTTFFDLRIMFEFRNLFRQFWVLVGVRVFAHARVRVCLSVCVCARACMHTLRVYFRTKTDTAYQAQIKLNPRLVVNGKMCSSSKNGSSILGVSQPLSK